jgi:hypothetical protein
MVTYSLRENPGYLSANQVTPGMCAKVAPRYWCGRYDRPQVEQENKRKVKLSP